MEWRNDIACPLRFAPNAGKDRFPEFNPQLHVREQLCPLAWISMEQRSANGTPRPGKSAESLALANRYVVWHADRPFFPFSYDIWAPMKKYMRRACCTENSHGTGTELGFTPRLARFPDGRSRIYDFGWRGRRRRRRVRGHMAQTIVSAHPPDVAELVIGRRFAPTRWLHPGSRLDAIAGVGAADLMPAVEAAVAHGGEPGVAGARCCGTGCRRCRCRNSRRRRPPHSWCRSRRPDASRQRRRC